MFGFSLSKILVLAAIIAAVWYGFKWVGRVNQMRQEKLKEGEPAHRAAEQMIECRDCGVFYPEGATHRCDSG